MAEVVLQAWDPEKTELKLALRMRKSISRAVKAMMQIQVAMTCGLLQLRRDHVLTAVRGLSVDNIQRLRHAPILEETKLFPPELLKELNEVNYQSLQTRALLRQVRGDVKQPSRGGFREGIQGCNNPYNTYLQDQRRSQHFRCVHRARSVSPVRCFKPVVKRRAKTPPGTGKTESQVEDSESNHKQLESPMLATPEKHKITVCDSGSDYSWEKEQLLEQQKIPVGGRLRFFWKEWRGIGASKRIARWLNRGYRLPFKPGSEEVARKSLSRNCPRPLQASYPENSEKGRALKEMVDTLLEKQVIEVIPQESLAFFNVVFLRPKPGGK